MAELNEVRERVRERYAAAAAAGSGCREGGCSCETPVFGETLYGADARDELPESALELSLGCGNPTAVAELRAGEVVLDLGSGGGADALIAARRVGPGGRVIGLDMTDEMLGRARENARRAGIDNVEWLKGYIEEIPLPDASVDVVVSNCVINLSADKRRVLREAARVLRPGGRLAVSDVIADEGMDAATRADMAAWTGCIAGALTEREFLAALEDAGFADLRIEPTHRVHEHAQAAVVRARRPAPRACSLDREGLDAQVARLRALAPAVVGGRSSPAALELELSPSVDRELVERTIEVERGCCPSLRIDYEEAGPTLRIELGDPAGADALNLLRAALLPS